MKRNNLRTVQLWVSASELTVLVQLVNVQRQRRGSVGCAGKLLDTEPDYSFYEDLSNYLKRRQAKDAALLSEEVKQDA